MRFELNFNSHIKIFSFSSARRGIMHISKSVLYSLFFFKKHYKTKHHKLTRSSQFNRAFTILLGGIGKSFQILCLNQDTGEGVEI